MSIVGPPGRMATSADVAAEAGVSRATVSVVLNGRLDKIRISDSTRERVLSVASRLGYTPNHAARSLRRKRTNILAYVLSNFDNPYSYEVMSAAQATAHEHGYTLSVMGAATDDLGRRSLGMLHGGIADGAIVSLPASPVVDELAMLVARGVPIVSVQHRSPNPAIPAVLVDLEAGGHLATSHLIGLGHRRIAHIGDRKQYMQRRRDRTDGYRRALDEAGIEVDPELVVEADNSLAGGAAAMARLMALADRPSAVFVFNDQMAIGALHEARSRGLRVPDDMALIGFDGVAIGAFVRPELSTVEHSRQELGRRAIEVLAGLINGEQPEERDQLLPARLLVRRSCGGSAGPISFPSREARGPRQ